MKQHFFANIIYKNQEEFPVLAVLADTLVRQFEPAGQSGLQATCWGKEPLTETAISEASAILNLRLSAATPDDTAFIFSQLLKELHKQKLAAAEETQGFVCNTCRFFTCDERVHQCPSCNKPLEKGKGVCWRAVYPGSDALEELPMPHLLPQEMSVGSSGKSKLLLGNLFWGDPMEDAVPAPWLQGLLNSLALAGFGDEGKFTRNWEWAWIIASKEYWTEYLGPWRWLLHQTGLPAPGTFAACQPPAVVDRKGEPVSLVLLAKNYGTDALRYALLSLKPLSGESVLSEDSIIQRINQDLANELGNLVSRIISMVERYADGLIPRPEVLTRTTADLELREMALETPNVVQHHIELLEPHMAVTAMRRLVAQTNRFVETTTPWQLVTGSANQERLQTVLYNLCEGLRFLSVALQALLPETSAIIAEQLGLSQGQKSLHDDYRQKWGGLKTGTRIMPMPPLFPRIVPGKSAEEEDMILRDELKRLKMVVARVVSAEKVSSSRRLLQLVLYDGTQRRQILAPIAGVYRPDELTGKKVIMLANLRPVTREGLVSEGEALLLDTEEGLQKLIEVDAAVAEGSIVRAISY